MHHGCDRVQKVRVVRTMFVDARRYERTTHLNTTDLVLCGLQDSARKGYWVGHRHLRLEALLANYQ